MAPDNKKVLRRLRATPQAKAGFKRHFTEAGAQQALDDMVQRLDEANPNNQWRLVSLGHWSFKLVWLRLNDVAGSLPDEESVQSDYLCALQ